MKIKAILYITNYIWWKKSIWSENSWKFFIWDLFFSYFKYKIECKMIVPNYFLKKNNFFPKNFIVFVKYSIFPNYFPKKIIIFLNSCNSILNFTGNFTKKQHFIRIIIHLKGYSKINQRWNHNDLAHYDPYLFLWKKFFLDCNSLLNFVENNL